MERVDLTKTTFEPKMPEPEKTRKKPVAFTVISVIALVMLIFLFMFLFKKYTNREALDQLESRVNMTINLAREAVNAEGFDEDYILIKFPDTSEIITKDGNMSFNGKELGEFLKGYIIVYKDDTLTFKLSDGTYCASKSFDDESYKLFIFGGCLNYDVEYKKE